MGWKNPLWGTLRGPDAPALRKVFESLSDFTVNPTFKTLTVTSTATFGSTVRAATRITIPASDSSNLWNVDNLAGTLRLFRENYAASGSGGGGVVRLTLTDAGVLTVAGSVSASGDITNTDASAGNVKLGGWSGGSTYRVVESPTNHILLSHATDPNMYLISDSGEVRLRVGVTDRITATAAGATVNGTLTASNDVVASYVQTGVGTAHPLWRLHRFGGTLDGSGNAAIAHNVSEGHRKITMAQAWRRNSAGAAYAVPLNIWAIDGGAIYMNGGAAGEPFRGMFITSIDNAGW